MAADKPVHSSNVKCNLDTFFRDSLLPWRIALVISAVFLTTLLGTHLILIGFFQLCRHFWNSEKGVVDAVGVASFNIFVNVRVVFLDSAGLDDFTGQSFFWNSTLLKESFPLKQDDSSVGWLFSQNKGAYVRQELPRSLEFLPLVDRARASSVCRRWNEVFHIPDLWRKFEFELSQPATSYLKSTHPDLIQQIIKKHADHLQYVSFKVDSSTESAEAACDILSQLVNCSIKTLGLISTAKPSFMDVSKAHFVSALTVVFVNSKSLSSIKIEDTPVDDPSLKVLVANNSDTLKLLKMSSCPHVSPAGILCVADQCHGLRELALNYYLLSDELLLALSSEKHVNLEHLRIDVVSENPGQVEFHTIKKQSWDALVKHSPKVNIVMYFFLYEEEFDPFFREETPVTHLYFGRAVSKSMLGRIGMNCPRLIELVVCANGLQPLDDELICIAERCKNLTAMGLGECEVTCRGFIEFVKMCGGRLTQLSIMEEVLIPDSDYNLDQIHSEVSKHLGRMWFPDMMPTW